jgi:hypothetical protein
MAQVPRQKNAISPRGSGELRDSQGRAWPLCITVGKMSVTRAARVLRDSRAGAKVG